MKTKKKHLSTKKSIKIQTHSFSEVFGKSFTSKGFKEAYLQELARLRLARQIRDIRMTKQLTQEEVAKKAHMPQSVVARIESGKHSMSLETLDRIAHALNKKVVLA